MHYEDKRDKQQDEPAREMREWSSSLTAPELSERERIENYATSLAERYFKNQSDFQLSAWIPQLLGPDRIGFSATDKDFDYCALVKMKKEGQQKTYRLAVFKQGKADELNFEIDGERAKTFFDNLWSLHKSVN